MSFPEALRPRLPIKRPRQSAPRLIVRLFSFLFSNILLDLCAQFIVFSLVSCVAMMHAVRAAMYSLKKTGTDFSSAKGMDPKAFFELMG